MSDFPRREISEIIEIANRETSVYSIFVEGPFDKDMFEKYLKSKGLEQIVSVYSIDTIEVPNDLIIKAQLNLKSNKSRVVTLAIEVSQNCGASSSRGLCIVDADSDRELGLLKQLPALLYTDFTCMEMYGFDPEMLAGIFEFSMGLENGHVSEFLGLAAEILPTLFALRCCNDELGLNATMPPLTSGFEKKKSASHQDFSPAKYVELFVQNNKMAARRGEILALYAKRLAGLSADLRHKAHGHDAVKLFYWYLNKVKVLSLNEEEIAKIGNRIFLSGIDFHKLDDFALFEKVLSGDETAPPAITH